MAKNFFQSVSHRFEKSSAMWIFGLILMSYGLYLGIQFFIEDYNANLMAYLDIPTRKVFGDLMIANMARFIQLAPVIFGFAFLRDTRKSNLLYLVMAGVFLIADWMIGIYYRGISIGLTGSWLAWTAIEDFVFFTAGSELLILFAAGVLWSMVFPLSEFVERIRSLFSETINLSHNLQNKMHHRNKPQTRNPAIVVNTQRNMQMGVRSMRTEPSERTMNERRTNGANERTNYRPKLPNEGEQEVKEDIIRFAKGHRAQHGSYPGPTAVSKALNCSKSYASQVLGELE